MLGDVVRVLDGVVAVELLALEVDDPHLTVVEVRRVVLVDQAHVLHVEGVGTVDDDVHVRRVGEHDVRNSCSVNCVNS